MKNHLLLVVLGVCVAAADAAPQTTSAAQPAREVTALARGWTLLAEGQADKAAQLAADLLRTSPRSVAVLSLLVDAELARGGPVRALDAYDKWLDRRRMEDGYALRRIAAEVLRAAARSEQRSRTHAIAALEADGDVVPSGQAPGASQDAAELIAQMGQPGPGRRNVIVALSRTKDARAVPPLTAALNDPDPIVRAAAAEALGALARPQTIDALRPLLKDQVFAVRVSAATALHAMKDASGTAFLRDTASSEFPAVRVVAARALKDNVDADWLAIVRRLAAEEDPAVRRDAAELIAPHDPELAAATLKPLLDDANPAIREVARESFLDAVVTDLTALKGHLRDQDATTRVRAAGRILQLTRQ